MVVYVDDFSITATVGPHTSQWSHLFADTQEELHAFAAKLGLKRSYFQPAHERGDGSPSPHWHYDVTAGKRAQAIALGAQPVEWRESPKIMHERGAKAADKTAQAEVPGKPPRHAWAKTDERTPDCGNCGTRVVQRRLAATDGKRPYVTEYTQGGRTFIADRLPQCGAPPPGQPPRESATVLADAANRAARAAFHRGDLAEASRLIANARALDPSREEMWADRERYLSRQAAQRRPYGLPLAEQTRQRMAEHGIAPDDLGLKQWAEHNAARGIGPCNWPTCPEHGPRAAGREAGR
jgi:hypothetical protein